MDEGGLTDYLFFVFIEAVVAGLASYMVVKVMGGKMHHGDGEREGLFESYGETDPGKLEERLINLEDELAEQAGKLDEIIALLRRKKAA